MFLASSGNHCDREDLVKLFSSLFFVFTQFVWLHPSTESHSIVCLFIQMPSTCFPSFRYRLYSEISAFIKSNSNSLFQQFAWTIPVSYIAFKNCTFYDLYWFFKPSILLSHIYGTSALSWQWFVSYWNVQSMFRVFKFCVLGLCVCFRIRITRPFLQP